MKEAGKRLGLRANPGLLLPLLTLSLAGCAAEAGVDREAQISSAPVSSYAAEDADRKLVRAANRFGLNLYGRLAAEAQTDGGANRMLSPAGLSMALSMLRAGAEGQTAQEMDKVLGLKEIGPQRLAEEQRVLRSLLEQADPSVRMTVANSIWTREDFGLKEDFAQEMERSYGAKTEALDFSSDKAADTMNRWASESTDGKIRRVIEAPIDPTIVMVLMNAMYFKGGWTVPFEPEATQDRPFVTEKGEKVEVPTMRQSGRYDYLDGDGFRAVRLPYGEKGDFGMILALPDEGVTLREFAQTNLPKFGLWSARFAQTGGSVELPKFKLQDSMMLNDALAALGMPSAFIPGTAELGGLSDDGENLFVSRVSQDTFVEVNEEGTEAAAVTVIAVEEGASPESALPFELKLNRPFFFAVTDRTTGLIVFMGEVGNPAES
ncbi:serpin family protein [Saccharibacillus alkalitolerans]|uniref:Serpin family protein n=1 Tax=Saccharibacillus alkalitolerans TaxID=2705290 RepID=A0ABX0F390_9BACL|nr:serpin family protein [Saccharibacillus alkalitolerans]NGZ74118.1 serpin family protein [Saccharibacillus alkalitolerans]